MSNQRAKEILETLLKEASVKEFSARIETQFTSSLSVIVGHACRGRNRAALAVVMTLFLKKVLSPKQDIRRHQKKMDGGFSGRSLDEKVVTPFLRENNFPYMSSGSGWLTRSFEQSRPYDLHYPADLKPKGIKEAFLSIVDAVQKGTADARECLKYLLHELVEWRKANASLKLAKPMGKRIEDIVCLIDKHWQTDISGVAKLPVLAIYAVYTCLVSEVTKYKDCQLLELLSHTSADSKTDRVGDIDVVDKNSKTVEAVEVKHRIALTCALIEQLKEKIAGSGLKTFYVLSTNEAISQKEMVKITDVLLAIRDNYGCQVIVNGVARTLRYYLRLLENTDKFVDEYVALMENDREIPFDLKKHWNEVVG
ncbi:MAG: restriction endonuclease, SacI family [Alphaproteobacteria bacterium GM202ARS2]|nr:restriction endonuclease, SacI family [Alphaproteobacteria bacterium GM202ARS2]